MDTRQILERTIIPPKNGVDAIFSRQLHSEAPIGGDAIIFPLEFGSTSSYAFVQAVRSTQEKIYPILKEESRAKEIKENEFFMIQENLHFSFSSTISITDKESYEAKCKIQSATQLSNANKSLHDFLNQKIAVSGEIYECIMKEDGHLLVRINIKPPAALLTIKEQISNLFGGSYVRHPEHEAQQTLASVIAVVNSQCLSDSGKNKINEELVNLHSELKKIESMQFLQVEWVHYRVRSLASQYRHYENVFQRMNTAEVHPATFRFGLFSRVNSTGNEAIHEADIHPAALPQPKPNGPLKI